MCLFTTFLSPLDCKEYGNFFNHVLNNKFTKNNVTAQLKYTKNWKLK